MKPVLFIWIPRTAGSSIWRCLEKVRKGITTQRTVPGHREFCPDVTVTTFQHTSIEALLINGIITPEWLGQRFIFSFVRNPWARLVSVYHHLKQGRPNQRQILRQHASSWKMFVEEVCSGDLDPIGLYSMSGLSYANRQTDWLRMPGELQSEHPWLPEIIGKQETLRQDWARVCERIGIKPNANRLAHINKSKHGHYGKFYDQRLRRLVAEYYKEEIELFDYRF